MEEHWIPYAELMNPVIDSSEGDETTSKQRFSLVGLDDSFPDKSQGHMMQICNCANYSVCQNFVHIFPHEMALIVLNCL